MRWSSCPGVIGIVRGPPYEPVRPVKPRRPRPATYGPELMPALVTGWETLRTPAGKLLAPMLRRDGEITLTDEQAALLSRMSAATIDN